MVNTRRRRGPDPLGRGTTDHYLDAELYDFEYRRRRHDVAWYRALAAAHLAGGGRVLELGAGTGRITVPLLVDGHEVVAVEHMHEMAERLVAAAARARRSERLRLVSGDIRSLEELLAGERFELVIAPFNVLMHLYTTSDLLACFRGVRAVLAQGGRFAFDVLLPDLEWLTWDPEARHGVTRFTHPASGEALVYSTNHVYDPATQICHVRIYYDTAPPAGRRFQPPPRPRRLVHLAHRQIFPEELRLLLANAGLELERHDGDFAGRPLRRGAESQVCVCGVPKG